MEGLDAIEDVLGPDPEGFPKFWDRCGKTGGAGFAAIDAITGEDVPNEGGPPQPKKIEEEQPASDSAGESKAWMPSKESLSSRGGKTVGIARGEMRALFMG